MKMKKHNGIMVDGSKWEWDAWQVGDFHVILENAEGKYIIGRIYDNGISIGGGHIHEYNSRLEAKKAIEQGADIWDIDWYTGRERRTGDIIADASRLKKAREAAGLSQSQLAKASGVNVRMIQHYEQRAKDINSAKVSTVLALADALGVEVRDIIE